MKIEESTALHAIEKAALAHFQLTWIHPFVDGNGRTARMLMNLILMENGYPPIIIQLEDRDEYYEVLRTAQRTGDTRPFIYFIYHVACRSQGEYISELKLSLEDLHGKSNPTIKVTSAFDKVNGVAIVDMIV